MTAVQIQLPPKLIPVFEGKADVRGAYGGRGSGKTRSFAKMAAVRGYIHGMAGDRGIILCARQFMNSLDDSSLEECKRAIEEEPFLASYYDLGEKYIKSKDGRISFAFSGLDRNIMSIKSKGRILLCWVDEAEPVTGEAWDILEPTLREEGDQWNAELWVTWNPRNKHAAVESRFRQSTDPMVKCVELNWKDNPAFPDKLERQRQRDLKARPDQYAHIWEGDFQSVVEGAYYAKDLNQAKAEKRIGLVAKDPLYRNRIFCDLGGTGAKADAFAMWGVQFAGLSILIHDYYEAIGQSIGAHARWLEENGYTPQNTDIYLPHDGEQQHGPIDSSWEKEFKKLGYTVVIVPNQGRGAAMQRVKAGRLQFSKCYFNQERTQAGLDALGWYHEKRDPDRNVGLGPEHDWASHGADAFGLMAVCYKEPNGKKFAPIKYPDMGIV